MPATDNAPAWANLPAKLASDILDNWLDTRAEHEGEERREDASDWWNLHVVPASVDRVIEAHGDEDALLSGDHGRALHEALTHMTGADPGTDWRGTDLERAFVAGIMTATCDALKAMVAIGHAPKRRASSRTPYPMFRFKPGVIDDGHAHMYRVRVWRTLGCERDYIGCVNVNTSSDQMVDVVESATFWAWVGGLSDDLITGLCWGAAHSARKDYLAENNQITFTV